MTKGLLKPYREVFTEIIHLQLCYTEENLPSPFTVILTGKTLHAQRH